MACDVHGFRGRRQPAEEGERLINVRPDSRRREVGGNPVTSLRQTPVLHRTPSAIDGPTRRSNFSVFGDPEVPSVRRKNREREESLEMKKIIKKPPGRGDDGVPARPASGTKDSLL